MAETIVFGGQKLDIDSNDELWKQLVKKYSQKKTGWEPMKIDGIVWCIEPTNSTFDGGVTQLLRNSYCGIAGDAHCAAFADKSFCEMQARAEEIRRKLLRFAAENDKPCAQRCNRYTISYNYGRDCLQINEWGQSPPIFEPAFETRECAERAMREFAEDWFWMAREYKPRLDQEV